MIYPSPHEFKNPKHDQIDEFYLRYLRSKTKDMILKNTSKLIEIDEILLKSSLFVSNIIISTSKVFHGL